MPKLEEFQNGVFTASELTILEGAVDDAWTVISTHGSSWHIDREEVARHVMTCAATGERNKAKLTRFAVEKLLGAND